MAATILIKAAKDAERLLKAVGAEYHFTLPTGETFTSQDAKKAALKYTGPTTHRGLKPKRHSMLKGYPHGFRVEYVRNTIKDLGVGEVTEIPMHDAFDNINDLRKTVAGAAMKKWGKDSHKTAIREDNSAVEILRTN
jgi:hypothetical protein